MATALLSFAHRLFGPGIWPGEWLWATAAAGALIALFPIAGSLLIALIRKGTGNRYDAVTLSVFGIIGVVSALLIPWLLAMGISGVHSTIREINAGAVSGTDVDLSAAELRSFGEQFTGIGRQDDYLGGGQTVYEVLTRPGGGFGWILSLGKLVVLPALCLLFVILQARAAVRRGPRWPGRLVWGSFLACVLLTAPVSANVAGLLWAGFLPVSVLGMIPILIVGPPSWSVINHSVQERPPPPAKAHQAPPQQQHQPQQPQRQHQPPPQQQVRNPPPYQPEPPPPPYRPEPLPGNNHLLAGRPPGQELLSGRDGASRLADTPGPLPFGAAAVPVGGPPVGNTRSAPSMWQHAGGRFRKIRPLGRGGFGTVWLAVDTQLDRTVAVKMAHAPDAETEERMLREARALAAVRHPNCVRVYDIVADTDGLGIVMEYIEGGPLADTVLDNGPLDDVAAARLWVTMAGALDAAHTKGVLHRDVKPSNVIIDLSGSAHLIDFGIARSKGDSTLTATGMMVGTPDFLAPETAAGSAATPASDAWQLAATVSFALTGQPPRGERENPMAALMAGAKAEPNRCLPTRSAHRRLLDEVLGADPARRPTLHTVVEQVDRWLANAGHAGDGPVTRIVPTETAGRPSRPRGPDPTRRMGS